MLECPFCQARVRPPRRDNWFECPACQNWIRLHVNQSGSSWLEAGYYANEDIHPLQIARPSDQRPRTTGRVSRPNIQDMDLETVQAQRQRVRAKLLNLEEDIQRAITLRSENRRNEQLTSQYNTDLSRYTREQNDWKLYERQLTERENELLEEAREQARRTRSSGLGLAFWFGAILSGGGIYAFSWLIGLHLDLKAYLYLFVIAVISGFLSLILTKID